MTSSLCVEQAPSGEELATTIATRLIEICLARQQDGGIPCLVLTGGSMGKATLSALATHPRRDQVNWQRVRFLWGDERWVPTGDVERNDRLADDLFFDTVNVDESLVHRVVGSDSEYSLDEAAHSYAQFLDSIDRIDVAMNGVGPDGHICSLFPGRDDLLQESNGTPAALPVRDSPKPPPERVTLSLPAVRRAEHVWLLAAGAEKAPAVAETLSPSPGSALLPAARVYGSVNTVLWADAAALGK
ncbi:MAG: 6-phosphogluconolactonase [Leucobacter sp.]